MTAITRSLLQLPLAAFVAVTSACSDNEAPPAEDHTPVSYNVVVNDVPQTAPYVLTAGQTTRVRLQLFNAAGDDLDDVEAEHFAGLTFNPASLATAVRLADHHYQFDVTAPAVGSGTMQVSFGHDEMADEKTFDPVAVNVMGSASPAQ
ncbi:MAG TPA: hypothetical protein VGJ36_11175 [Gemmatimonadales bacterium]